MSDSPSGEGAQHDQTKPSSVRIRSSAWVFAAQVSKTAMSIPIGIILARTLGASGKGAVSVVQTIAAVGVVLLNLGMPNAVMWLAAKGRATGRQALKMALLFAVGIVVLGAGVVLLVGPEKAAKLIGLDSVTLLAVAIFATAPSMIAYFEDAYLVGRGVVRNTQLTDVTALAIQLATLAVLAFTHQLTVISAVLVWLACTVSATIFKAYLALRAGRAAVEPGVRQLWSEGRVYGLKAWLGSTVNLLSLRQDVLLLAAFAGTAEVGIYTVGVAAAELAWYIPNALQNVATAKFSAEEGSLELAQRLNRSVWPFTLAFSLAIFVLAVPLIPLVYGPTFKASILPFVFLIPGILATSMSSSLSAWLSGRGHPEDPAFANVVNMIVNLIANIILAPRLGARGAALASSISYSAATALIIWRFHVRSGSRVSEVLVPRGSDLRSLTSIMTNALKERLSRTRG